MSLLFYQVMQDNAGNLLFGVTGTMRFAGTATLATIYGDEALTVILPNPMTNHPSFGSFKCYLPVGDFDFYMAKAGYTFETMTGIQGLSALAQQDASNVTITGGSITGLTNFSADPPTLVVDQLTHRVGVLTPTPRYLLDVLGLAQINALGLNVGPDLAYALRVVGNAFFNNGSVGIGGAPRYMFDVFGHGQINTLGVNVAPDAANALTVSGKVVVVGTAAISALGLNVAPDPAYTLRAVGNAFFSNGSVGIGGEPRYMFDVFGAGQIATLGVNAPPDATNVLTVNGRAQISALGLSVAPDPAYALRVVGDVFCSSGSVGIGGAPRYMFDVFGAGQITTLGVNVTPDVANALSVNGRTVIVGNVGIGGVPRYLFDVFGAGQINTLGVNVAPDVANALTVSGKVVVVGQASMSALGLNVAPDPAYTLRVVGDAFFSGGSVGIGGAPRYLFDVFGPGQINTLGVNVAPDVANALTVSGRVVLGGNVGIGGVPTYLLDVFGQSRLGVPMAINATPQSDISLRMHYNKSGMAAGVWLQPNNNDADPAPAILFANVAGAGVGGIVTSATATTYATTSDARLKQDVEPLTGALDVLLALSPVSFTWKVDGSPGRGLLAHELQLVVPEAVVGQPDAVNADGSIQPQQVDYSKLVPYLISAVQELAQQREPAMPTPSALASLGGRVAVLFRNRTGAIAGSIQADGTGTAYNTISDHRLNHADIELEDGLDLLKQLRPVRFLWSFNDGEGVGFLGHQVAEVISGVITGERDAVDDDGQLLPQQIDYGKLVPYLVSAVQTLARQVETLTARLATLEAAPGA